MTAEKAIQLLRAIQEPEAWELPITQDAYLALDMAINVLKKQQISEDIKQAKQNQPVDMSTLLSKEEKQHVSFGVYQQVAWERDVATEQLRELGYSLGEKIITCKNCEHWGKKQGRRYCFEMYFDQDDPNFYCGYAKEKEEIDECQDCEAYECYKNGIHAKCPKTGFFDDCAKAEREHNEAGWMGMSKELKPCPFCGGEARLLLNAKRKIYGKDEYRTGVVACCNVCEARMFYGSEKLAIDAWNRRTGESE